MLALILLFFVAIEAVWSITNGTRPRIYMYPEVDPPPARLAMPGSHDMMTLIRGAVHVHAWLLVVISGSVTGGRV